jgi:two-component system, NtrC family, sensor kinase
MKSGMKDIREPFQFVLFRSVRNKLLILMIALSFLPLMGMSIFSYVAGKKQIQDSIRLSLWKMAQDAADKFDLLLLGKREEIHAMAITYPMISRGGDPKDVRRLLPLLNNYCFNYEGYDALIVTDSFGKIIGINSTDRNMSALPAGKIAEILGSNISNYPEEQKLFLASSTGHNSTKNWYQSKLVQNLYDPRKAEKGSQYNIAFSEPIRDPESRQVLGVWINILNWSYLQNVLDSVEADLAAMDLHTGHGFAALRDATTIVGYENRSNRNLQARSEKASSQALNKAGFLNDSGMRRLHDAILNQDKNYDYSIGNGNIKIAGLAPISDTAFGWIVGVEIDGADVFRPVKTLSFWLLGVAILLACMVVLFTYWIAEGIAGPLKTLIRSALTIAQGNFNQRVAIRSSDELGILASTFNEMARALSAREVQLQELTHNLETMVRERTMELENSHEALKRAYLDLQSAQEQLIQTEKMASLGQLVSGIAHEIKNPLNFIYGNTGFLSEYTQKLQMLVEKLESLPSMSKEDRAEILREKESMHYAFIKDDLKILIDNFSEGARRINTIVSDLRTFSRMDTDSISDVDLHASLEMSLNLLRNQYKNRIEIHKEYGDIPKIQGYAGKLNQVLMNLLSNAFHAIQNKGDVWIRTRSNNGAVEIEIEDNGAGIPRENLKRIFEPFFTTKPVGQGTGLGLSISYGIIEQHQGKIHVTSVLSSGTTFTVRLPIFQEKAE